MKNYGPRKGGHVAASRAFVPCVGTTNDPAIDASWMTAKSLEAPGSEEQTT